MPHAEHIPIARFRNARCNPGYTINFWPIKKRAILSGNIYIQYKHISWTSHAHI